MTALERTTMPQQRVWTTSIAAITLVATLAACTGGNDNDSDAPKGGAVPAPSKAVKPQTLDWLHGKGQVALNVHTAARSLLAGDVTKSQCDSTLDDLERAEPPAVVSATIAGVTSRANSYMKQRIH